MSKFSNFGLAKAFTEDQEEMILSNSPTVSVAVKRKGIVLRQLLSRIIALGACSYFLVCPWESACLGGWAGVSLLN